MECQPGTALHTTLGSLTIKTAPQPMIPEPDPGDVPQGRPWRDDG